MPNLSIKNVPENVVEKLRAQANRNHRSLQGELMALVCKSVEEPTAEAFERRESGWKTVEQILADRKSERARPVSQGPLAADIIRQERDAR